MEYLPNYCGKTLGKCPFVENNIMVHLKEIESEDVRNMSGELWC
jgi:hypothetical protein